MYCRKCGLEISDDSNSCPFCGEKNLQPYVGPVDPVPPADKRPDKKLLFLLSALTAALAVACILSFRQVSFLNQQLSDAEAMERALTWENGVVPDAEKPTVEVSTITSNTAVGDRVQFGVYEQDNNRNNGKEPIEWIVVDEDDDRFLLVSSKVLDCACYNDVWTETGWKTCSLRDWLNKSFMERAFTVGQKNIITKWHSSLNDRVFILSKNELNKYLPSVEDRMAKVTSYAEARGAFAHNNGNAWWWVRTPGESPYYAAYVNCLGDIIEDGSIVFNNAFGVRPVIWVRK